VKLILNILIYNDRI